MQHSLSPAECAIYSTSEEMCKIFYLPLVLTVYTHTSVNTSMAIRVLNVATSNTKCFELFDVSLQSAGSDCWRALKIP